MDKIGSFLVSTSFVLGASVLPFATAGLAQAEAATIVKINQVSYLTTANLNLQTGASTKTPVLIKIPKGKTVIASEQAGSWYKVSYTYVSGGKTKTVTGWVYGTYLKKSSSGISKLAVTAKSVKFTQTTYQTTASSYLHTGAGTAYKTLYKVPKGGIVTSSEKKDNWYHASYMYSLKGKKTTLSGWISGSDLKEYYSYTTTGESYYFTNKTAGLYATPDTKNKAVAQVAAGNGLYSTQKVVNSIGKTWYKVTFNNRSLYVNSSDVKLYTAKTFAKTNYKANADTYVYQYPGYGFTKQIKLPKDAAVTSAKSVGSWYVVTYNGKTGFVLNKYLSKVTSSTAKNTVSKETISGQAYLVTADSLNLRVSDSLTAKILTAIPNGTTVTPILKISNWYMIKYNGLIGYVSGTYLRPYNRADDYRFIDLRTQSPVTAAQINAYVAKNVNGRASVLTGKGQAFINAGKKYGVNALYLAAHAIHESGFGMSGISLGKNNLFGYGAYDATPFIGAYRFAKVEDCINYIAQKIKSDYLNPNGSHFEGAFLGYRTNSPSLTRMDSQSVGMNFFYASDPNWGNAIAQHMQNILAYNKAYYATAKANTSVPVSPGIPAGNDTFPAGIQAVAKVSLSPDIKAGTKFTLLEKSNDYSIKVQVGNKAPTWISSIAFSHYTDYLSVLNLGRVTASALNVRATTSTASNKNIITQLNLNNYVQFVLDAKGKIVMDSSKNWYQIRLANNKLGWVYASYIYRELQ